MNAAHLVGRLLGLDEAQAIDRIRPSLAAAWVRDGSAWLLFGCIGLVALALVFYVRYQGGRRLGPRMGLAAARALVLCLLLVILAEPVLTVRVTSRLRPTLWLLFDGTDSMALADEIPQAEQARLAEAVGLGRESAKSQSSLDEPPSAGEPSSVDRPSTPPRRIDYLKALVRKPDGNVLERLGDEFRLRAFLFDRPDGVRAIEPAVDRVDGRLDRAQLAEQLTTEGEVSALGAALGDLARRHATGNLAGVVIFSDFNQNSGPPALEEAERLGVKIHTVGVGPVAAVDLAVDLQVPPVMKKDERSSLVGTLRQDGFTGETVAVRFRARPVSGSPPAAEGLLLAERAVTLNNPTETIELPYVPEQTGRWVFRAEVEPLGGEVIEENNRAARETTVRDDFIRLLFVEYEPTWEWRFIKEVFHRDKLVGMRGFRTFLRSADPKVRKTNELFLTTLSPARSEFFAHDVIVLGDMPASALTPGFCRMTEEFVGDFGGGLVVVAGPRFGPGQLGQTLLGDLLPVKVDPNGRARCREPFRLRRTADADQYDFMRLGQSARENEKAWDNLGPLSWYQPVERLRPLATALAEHPTDACVDGKTRQPLIAVGNYGRGEVVYLGFNETWRLRRRYGEQYYRQFWGQMIHRLALRHALGTQKRFVARSDRSRYQADDQVLLTVEAYDAEFQRLTEQDVPGRKLSAELTVPGNGLLGASNVRPLGIPQLRDGMFEARIPVFAAGEHRVRVEDPIGEEDAEITFEVAQVSVERQRAVRNVALQKALADATGGRSDDLTTVGRLPDEIEHVAQTETSIRVIPLWNTWLSFACVVLLMLGEWLGRKWVNLP